MSISASLKITFSTKKNISLNIEDIIKSFPFNGWNLINNNIIHYLEVGDTDCSNWLQENITENEFINLVKIKEAHKETIGVVISWEDTDIGATVLFHYFGNVSFLFNINRKIIYNNITDVNWYLNRILPIFETEDLTISYFSFEQIR